MAENDIGSLVVLKPEGQQIAGIVTERGRRFLRYFLHLKLCMSLKIIKCTSFQDRIYYVDTTMVIKSKFY